MKLPTIISNYKVKMSPFHEHEENGINYYLIEDLETDLVKVELVCKSGIKYQNKSFQYRIMTELLLEGTQQYPGNSLKEKIEELGGNIDVDCSRDHIIIELIFLKQFKEELLQILNEILFHPTFSEEAFTRMISNLKTDYEISKTKSNVIAGKILMQELFKNHYYGIYADEEDFDKLTIQDIKNIHQEFLSTIRYVFVGGAATTKIFYELSEILPKYNALDFTRIISPTNVADVVTPKESKFEQDTIRFGAVVNQNEVADIFAFKMANLIFGGFFGSRLNKTLREDKGWTYGVFSTIVEMEDASYLIISSDLKKGTYEEASALIDSVFSDLCNNEVKSNELELAAKYINGSLLQKIDGVFGQLGELQRSVLKGRSHIEYYTNYSESINAVSSKQLQQSFQQNFNYQNLVKVLVN